MKRTSPPKSRRWKCWLSTEAHGRLAAIDPELARLVELRHFGGLTIEAAAQVHEVSPATGKWDRATMRAWLRRDLSR